MNENKISFKNFINRIAFWMATGSGKTLIIIKLIEILGKLIQRKEIPANDILYLTYRDDLLKQFKNFVKEFNDFYENEIQIRLESLKDYDRVKEYSGLGYLDTKFQFLRYNATMKKHEKNQIFQPAKSRDCLGGH